MPEQRKNDALILSKLDKHWEALSDIRTDIAVIKEKVGNLECIDAGTRLTKLESRNKSIAIVGGVLLSIATFKQYLIKIFLG